MKNAPDPLEDPRFADVLSRLRGQSEPEPSADFTARTVARLRRRIAARRPAGILVRRIAAAAAIVLGAGVWMIPRRPPAPMARGPAPIDLLMAAQRPDGGWSAGEQPGRPRYDTGVTALAVLALIHADPVPPEGPRAAALRAGIDHLTSQVGPDGRIGDDSSGAGFSRYLAGKALQAAARLPDTDPAWRAAAIRLEPHLPSDVQMAKLNGNLARPATFPTRWADAGGPVALAALQMLAR